MVVDKLENHQIYSGLHKRFQKAFDFILRNDLNTIDLGKHTIEGEDVFAIVMEYTTQAADLCKSETHKKYIDIQFMISGAEHVGFTTLHSQEPTTPYNEEGDFMFYSLDKLPEFALNAGHFAIFFPDDIHKTMIQTDKGPDTLRKVVIKVLK